MTIDSIFEIIIQNYQKKYEELKTGSLYNIIEDYNIQYYKPNQGFKILALVKEPLKFLIEC
jgi:hypothetical protein